MDNMKNIISPELLNEAHKNDLDNSRGKDFPYKNLTIEHFRLLLSGSSQEEFGFSGLDRETQLEFASQLIKQGWAKEVRENLDQFTKITPEERKNIESKIEQAEQAKTLK